MESSGFDLAPAASRSVQTIVEIADHVSPRGLRREVGQAVKGLFDLLAWSDGRLDPAEAVLLDRVCLDVPAFGDVCGAMGDYQPLDPILQETPGLLTVVAEHDRRTGERLAPVLIAALETFGHAVIAASGIPLDIEKSELYTTIESLRRLSRALTTAVPIASV